jgi:hypothetical protein
MSRHFVLCEVEGQGYYITLCDEGLLSTLPFKVKELTQTCSFPKVIKNIFFHKRISRF